MGTTALSLVPDPHYLSVTGGERRMNGTVAACQANNLLKPTPLGTLVAESNQNWTHVSTVVSKYASYGDTAEGDNLLKPAQLWHAIYRGCTNVVLKKVATPHIPTSSERNYFLLDIKTTGKKNPVIPIKMQLNTPIPTLITTILFITQASAHFLLNYPNTIGFDDEKEDTAPCGGFNVTFDNATDFHVDGDAIALTSTHPQATWSFRATLDKTGTGDNFTDLLPVVSQAGLGAFCEPGLVVPGTWAGSPGVIQVIQHGADGQLYQCAAINFVAGKADSVPPSCKNATGLTASFTTDASLPATAAATPGPSSSMAMSGSTTTSATPAPSASAASSAAASIHHLVTLGPLLWSSLTIAGLGTVMGFLYL